MGHATHVERIETNGPMPVKDILSDSLSRFRDEYGYNYSPSAYTAYLLTKEVPTENEARQLIDALNINSNSNAPVVAYTNDYTETTKKVTLELTREQIEAIQREQARADYATKSRVKSNFNYVPAPYNWVGLYDNETDKSIFAPNVVKATVVSVPKVRAAIAKATEGKIVTRYVIIADGREEKNDYDTLAEARSEAIRQLNMPDNARFSKLTIEARTRRDTGQAMLVEVARNTPESAKVTFEVTIQTAKPNGKIAGYLVAYDYHM